LAAAILVRRVPDEPRGQVVEHRPDRGERVRRADAPVNAQRLGIFQPRRQVERVVRERIAVVEDSILNKGEGPAGGPKCVHNRQGDTHLVRDAVERRHGRIEIDNADEVGRQVRVGNRDGVGELPLDVRKAVTRIDRLGDRPTRSEQVLCRHHAERRVALVGPGPVVVDIGDVAELGLVVLDGVVPREDQPPVGADRDGRSAIGTERQVAR
jgi:hypothetical protein